MIHYVCGGECGGSSEMPGTCQAKDCSDYGLPLKPCNCDNGKHDMEIELELDGFELEE